jgi:hypothetical protein
MTVLPLLNHATWVPLLQCFVVATCDLQGAMEADRNLFRGEQLGTDPGFVIVDAAARITKI